MERIFILFVICIILCSCSQKNPKIQPSTKYFLHAGAADDADLSNITGCLKDAGVHYKIKNLDIYVPENEGELAENCN